MAFEVWHDLWLSHPPQLTRGRILHDLEEIEETMANVEDKNDERLQSHAKGGPKAAGAGSTVVQVGCQINHRPVAPGQVSLHFLLDIK